LDYFPNIAVRLKK